MSPARRLLQYFRRYRLTLTFGALCVVLSVTFSLIKPMIIRSAVDDLTLHISVDVLLRFGILFVAAAAIEGIFLYLQRRIIIGASRQIEFDMRGEFYDHLQALPQSYFQTQRTGDLLSRASTDLSSVRMLVGPAVMHAFASLLVVSGSFFMMYRIEKSLALISLFAIPAVAGAAKYFGQRIHDRFKSVQDHFGDISARVQENLSGVRVVRAFGQEENELDTFKRMNREYVDRNRSLIRMTALFYPLLHCVIGFLFVFVFFLGSRKMIEGTMSLGSFVAFQFYLGRMVWPLIALGWVMNLFQRGMASMKRMSEVWDVPRPVEQVMPDGGSSGSDIEFDHLTFSYDVAEAKEGKPANIERPVLRDLTLRIPAGTTVGVIGRTGSGKSTLLALLSRTYTAPPHSIRIGGRWLEDFSAAQLREKLGVVPQETFLFSESIEENIRFGRGNAPDEEVARAAELAGLSADVVTFPDGLKTIIGERGITLSGGQKQRTAIARALIRNPEILLLDDSLSAVDTATEERILSSLREIRRGRTVVIVSHRVSSVKDADQIVVLDQGAIVERGTHEELLVRGGFYAEMYRSQTLEAEIEEIA
jgi:ATP-binding cassette subfamily B protein